MIVKNEESCIRRCLESVAWADEIVVVDSGSTDGTEAICREFTDKFIYREWPGSNPQRQFALKQCSNLWVLFIDADEAVSDKLRDSIQKLLSGKTKHDAYYMLRRNYYRDQPLYCGSMVPKKELRLFRKDRCSFVDRMVHGKIEVAGSRGWVKGYLEHYNITHLSEWVEKNIRYARVGAKDDFDRGKRIGVRHFIGAINLFFKRYFLLGGFLGGVPGLVFSVMPAYFRLLHYCIMWEMQQDERKGKYARRS